MQFTSTTHGKLIKLIRENPKATVQVYTSLGYVKVSRAAIVKTLRRYGENSTAFFNQGGTPDNVVISIK